MKRFFDYIQTAVGGRKSTKYQKAAEIDGAEHVIIDSSALHCPVCYCVFASTPLILSCGHSFCRRCVRRLVENCFYELGSTFFECPLCRQMIPSGTHFTKNYLADAVLQSLCEISQNGNEFEMDHNLRLSYKVISQKYLEEQAKNNILQRQYEDERIRSRRYLTLLVMGSVAMFGSMFLYKLLFC